MNLKLFFNDLKDFIIYLVTQPLIYLYESSKDIMRILKRKMMWVYVFGSFFIIFAIFNSRAWMYFSLGMFFMFFLVHQWEDGDFKNMARSRWRKKHGIKKFKK